MNSYVKITFYVECCGKMVYISIWVGASWITSVMSSVVPMVWPRMASVGIMVTVAKVSLMIWLWSGSTGCVPVFVMVAWGWCIGISMLGVWSVAVCWCTWRWYPVWAIHYYMSVFITLKTLYIRAMMCYVTWLLTLETMSLFVRHNIHCWGWYQCGCKLLCGLELLNVRYSIWESLLSLFINSSSQSMSVLEALNKDSYGGGVVGKTTSLGFSFKMVYVHSERFLLFCCISIKKDMEVWISELHIFNCNTSLISSQDLPDVIASVIKVCVKPFDLACASFVWLSAVRSAAVSMSTSQSSSCVVSCSLNTDISCSKEFVRLVCFWAEHRVFV